MKTGPSCASVSPARFLYDAEGAQVWEIDAHTGLSAVLLIGQGERVVLLPRRIVGTEREQAMLTWATMHRGPQCRDGTYVRLC